MKLRLVKDKVYDAETAVERTGSIGIKKYLFPVYNSE